MDANTDRDARIVRKLEAMLADWDREGGETYLEFAERLLRRVREEDAHGLPKKDM